MDKYEKKLNNNNIYLIGGIDEAGRGPLVGPVVSACVVLPVNYKLKDLNDSKKLSEKTRNKLFEILNKEAIGIGIGIVDNYRIDEINILEATKESMKLAVIDCLKHTKIDHLLIDAVKLNVGISSTSIIKGDTLSNSIAAASIIAKVTRDKIMYDLDKEYPMYDYKNNKGYPTKKHLESIKKYGIMSAYRKSYAPIKDIIDKS